MILKRLILILWIGKSHTYFHFVTGGGWGPWWWGCQSDDCPIRDRVWFVPKNGCGKTRDWNPRQTYSGWWAPWFPSQSWWWGLWKLWSLVLFALFLLLNSSTLQIENIVEEEEEDPQELGRGSRQRKEVDYSDSLTDREWLRVSRIMIFSLSCGHFITVFNLPSLYVSWTISYISNFNFCDTGY